jgi:hypothetical protein
MSNRTDSEPVPRSRARVAGAGARRLDSGTVVSTALWLIVGIGLLYGVWETVVKVSALFN